MERGRCGGRVVGSGLNRRIGAGSAGAAGCAPCPRTLRPTSSAADRPASVLDELSWRGLVALTTDEQSLAAALAGGPITAYCGFDPTAPSLHFGNLVQLIVLRKLQRAGHRIICLVGGSTGLIGDPRPSAERVLKTKEQTAEWVGRIQQQVLPFLDFDGDNPALLVNNLDWTAPMSALDFLRDIGKHFRVNTMIRKDAVAARLNSDEGISYTEFSYQLLQGLDYLHLFREYGCTLQTGGQDQWGNLTAGTDLIRRVTGESVHLLATPLITDSHGQKFGKSEGNAVWLSPEMTSPYAFYQYWLNVEDASVGALLKVFTDRTADEIEELERRGPGTPAGPGGAADAGLDVTSLVHGADAAAARRSRPAVRCSDAASSARWMHRPCTRRLSRGGAAPGGRRAAVGGRSAGDRRTGPLAVRGPAGGRRGRGEHQQRPDHRPRSRPGRRRTCCTGDTWCCVAGRSRLPGWSSVARGGRVTQPPSLREELM